MPNFARAWKRAAWAFRDAYHHCHAEKWIVEQKLVDEREKVEGLRAEIKALKHTRQLERDHAYMEGYNNGKRMRV